MHSHWNQGLYNLQIYTVWNPRVVIDHTFIAIPINLVNFTYFLMFYYLYLLRNLLLRLKNYHEFLRFFLCWHLHRVENTKWDAFAFRKFRIQVHQRKFLKRVRDLFILMDSVVINIHFRRSQPPVSLKMTSHQRKYWNRIWPIHQIPFKGPFLCVDFCSCKGTLILIRISIIPGAVSLLYKSSLLMGTWENLKWKQNLFHL